MCRGYTQTLYYSKDLSVQDLTGVLGPKPTDVKR